MVARTGITPHPLARKMRGEALTAGLSATVQFLFQIVHVDSEDIYLFAR